MSLDFDQYALGIEAQHQHQMAIVGFFQRGPERPAVIERRKNQSRRTLPETPETWARSGKPERINLGRPVEPPGVGATKTGANRASNG